MRRIQGAFVKSFSEKTNDAKRAASSLFSSGQERPSLPSPEALKEMLSSRFCHADDQAWLAPLCFSFSSSHSLSVRLPHELFFRWYTLQGKIRLESCLRELFGPLDIGYVWPGCDVPQREIPAPQKGSSPNRPAPSFEDFFPGGRNRDVVQLLRRALLLRHSPIFLHGPSGTGKSHLLLAAASELNHTLHGRVRLFSGRDILSLFRLSPELAYSELRSCAAVLIDDLHILEHSPEVQKQLAAFLDAEQDTLFLAAYQTDDQDENGQKLLPMLYDRLCAKLSLGLTEPDLDVRLRFAQTAMEQSRLPESREHALFLARHCLRLRHIRGVLEQVRFSYEQSAVLPDIGELSSLMSRAGAPQPVDTDTILSVVASRYGCTISELTENTKDRRITLPRQIAMYLCRELLGESYPSLGLLFGGKDHSTVIYAIRKIENLKVTNNDMNIQLTELTKQCRNGLPRREN